MWSKLLTFRTRGARIAGALLIAAVAAAVLLWPRGNSPNGGERTRADLDLRDGILYLHGSDAPFTGTLVEDYGKDSRKLAISIRNGRADGLSRGWHENGQMEVEETFAGGISNGVRTRWHVNGVKKSEASIVDGKITGRYVGWHDNGQKAAEVPMVDGMPHGLAEAWHPSGKLKSRVQLHHGVPGEKEFFPDAGAVAQAGEPLTVP